MHCATELSKRHGESSQWTVFIMPMVGRKGRGQVCKEKFNVRCPISLLPGATGASVWPGHTLNCSYHRTDVVLHERVQVLAGRGSA